MANRELYTKPLIVAFANNKGGVAKTTTALEMARNLAERGFKVLAIDTDPQHNMSDTLNAQNENHSTIYDVLLDFSKFEDAIQHHSGNFDFIASDELVSRMEAEQLAAKEVRLKKALSTDKAKEYDFVLLDTPTRFGIITSNVFTAANEIVVPTQAESYAVTGILQLQELLEGIREYSNPGLEISGVLITKFRPNTSINSCLKDTTVQVAEALDTKVYKTTIRDTTMVPSSQSVHMGLSEYCKSHPVTQDYSRFVDEFLEDHGLFVEHAVPAAKPPRKLFKK